MLLGDTETHLKKEARGLSVYGLLYMMFRGYPQCNGMSGKDLSSKLAKPESCVKSIILAMRRKHYKNYGGKWKQKENLGCHCRNPCKDEFKYA